MALDASRTIHGSKGKILIDGVWQTNLTETTAEVELDKKELNLVGDDWTRYKQGSKKGTGSMSGYKVSSAMIQRGFKRFEVISSLEDPEAYGHERIRLMNCMADKLNLINLKANELVEEETPFTFEGYELLDPIVVE
ncbi:phage tail tube protein [Clostridium botulinum]|uniref:phage tail tube protein n=1 Tax=Clostridium botulinum TaxID=1491 RepID=UPI001E4C8799|nr:phage tail tube protein [Clostridium botulinum]MCC5422521.1 phage tail tube protein [Clostridium botulinum]MCJ8173231.1 phage tail tube protein [Clostridium botulinum]